MRFKFEFMHFKFSFMQFISKEWEYEKEYRIIKYFNNDSNVLNLPIKSICFGAKTPKEDKYLLRKILSNKNIEFYEANFNDRILNNVIINKLKQIKIEE